MEQDKVFQEVDVLEVLRDIGSKNKALQAKVLQEAEKYVTNKEDFAKFRKFILDEQNAYTRSIVRLIFGDIEFMNFSRK